MSGQANIDGGRQEDAPIPWAEVLLAELKQFDPSFREETVPPHDTAARLDALNHAAFERGHAALCLSGGGIRSASFAIGVLQTLGRHRVLQRFDYLSTVSGGGFAGGWLSAWLHRASRAPRPDDADERRETAAAREGLAHLTQGSGRTGDVEPWPVTRLRKDIRYLNPDAGLFSADFWGLMVTMFRNLLLNWLVTVPLLAAALLVPRIHYALIHISERDINPDAVFGIFDAGNVPLLIGWLGQLAALGFTVADLPSYGNRGYSQRQFILRALLPLCLGTLALTYFWALNQLAISPGVVILTSAGLNAAAWIVIGFLTGQRPFRPRTWFAGAVAGAVAGAGMAYLMHAVWPSGIELHTLYIAFAFPAVLVCVFLGIVAMIGLASSEVTAADIEWWSRSGAWAVIVSVGWLAACGVVFGGPWAINGLEQRWSGTNAVLAGLTPVLGGIGAWLSRPGANGWSLMRRIGLRIAAPSFAVLLLVGLAYANDEAVRYLATRPVFQAAYDGTLPLCARENEERTAGRCRPAGAGLYETLALGAVLLLVGFGSSRFVAANKFSLHGMYRQRLTRTFLGASRMTRRPNPFTGFDAKDDLEMASLAGQRPFHLVNVTLNRRAGAQGAHHRQSESFTFSPLHAGNAAIGYRPATEFAYDASQRQAITLGTALTVSGAAASPALGEFSTSSLAFLLTLLNARLGAWFGNPGAAGHDSWRDSDPKAGVGPIIREMLGRTTASNPYIYLSDGGHFDNLGFWEVALRRCKYVVIVDAGCDPLFTLNDLATAVRQARIDHGVRVEIDAPAPGSKTADGHPHVLTGTIRYEDGAHAAVGRLIYIKPALTGDEAVDVLHYKKAFSAFPHESTADQWFSEAQFESYRMLGVHSAEAALQDMSPGGLGRILADIEADAQRPDRVTAASPEAATT